jgi:hypothetical protein
MKRVKTAFHKIAISSIALFFAVGCATVTDANADIEEKNSSNFLTIERAGDTWNSDAGDGLDPIRGDRPVIGE